MNECMTRMIASIYSSSSCSISPVLQLCSLSPVVLQYSTETLVYLLYCIIYYIIFLWYLQTTCIVYRSIYYKIIHVISSRPMPVYITSLRRLGAAKILGGAIVSGKHVHLTTAIMGCTTILRMRYNYKTTLRVEQAENFVCSLICDILGYI